MVLVSNFPVFFFSKILPKNARAAVSSRLFSLDRKMMISRRWYSHFLLPNTCRVLWGTPKRPTEHRQNTNNNNRRSSNPPEDDVVSFSSHQIWTDRFATKSFETANTTMTHGGGRGGDGAENEHPQQQQQRRVSFQAGRPPVHKEGASWRSAPRRYKKRKAGGRWSAGKRGNTTAAAFQRNQFGGSRRGSGSQMEEAQQRASRDGTAAKTERYRETSETETVRFNRKAPESLKCRERPSRRKKRRTAMVVEELDAMNTNKAEGEHSAAASRDGDRAGSFAENNTDEGFAGYDFNGNRTAQPMFRPKSPHAKQRKLWWR